MKKATIREAIAVPSRVSVVRTPAPRRIRKSASRFTASLLVLSPREAKDRPKMRKHPAS